jgi:hypothetical protein
MGIHLICFLVVYTYMLLEFWPGDWFLPEILMVFSVINKEHEIHSRAMVV